MVDDVFAERRRREASRRRGLPLALSLALHAGLLTAFVLAPALAARHREPGEFVQIQIVPSQRLGVAKPAAPKPEPERPKPVERRPEPAPPAETEPQPKPRPTLTPAKPAPVRETPPAPTTAPGDGRGAGEPAERQGSPQGSSLGTASFGAVAGLDNPNFVYNYYIDQMLAAIGSRWIRPPADPGIEARVHFRIVRDGTLEEIEVVESSGLSSFDLAALRAVSSASPLPPLPNSYERESLGVNLIFR